MKKKTLKLCEIFFSISGEGILQGCPAVFIRFSGCNMECSYCDTRYHSYEYLYMSVYDVLQKVKEFNCNYFVITGGEPFTQHKDIFLLIKTLSHMGTVEIETNGSNLNRNIAELIRTGCTQNILLTVDLKLESTNIDYTISFEKGINMVPSCRDIAILAKQFPLCLCIKIIIQKESDIDVAYTFFKAHASHLIIVSPCYGIISPTHIAEYMVSKNYGNLKLQIQLHKYLWSEDRGK